MTERADVLVLGVGGCGSSALYHLAKRSVHAIGIDRFEPGHARGSSHGETRVIRQAYFEHPDYVPLLERSYALWQELESESGAELLDLCGLVLAGPASGEILRGARLARERYQAPLEEIPPDLWRERFPALVIPEDFECAWEPLGGFLHVERCVQAYVRAASRLGARVDSGRSVLSWSATASGVRVETEEEAYEAQSLVLTPGPWAIELLPEIAERAGLHVLRKVLLWYPGRSEGAAAMPAHTFFLEMPYGGFYGFPSIDGASVKLAEHTGGERVRDPLELDRSLHAADLEGPDRFVRDALPGLRSEALRHSTCMYTMSSDAHFVVDRHPAHPNVALAVGFSGHGFKFMSAMGAILAELVLDGSTASPIDFLRMSRFESPAQGAHS